MRVLVFNLGNTTLLGGAVVDGRVRRRVRVPAREALRPDGWRRLVGERLRGPWDAIAVCSVVPAATPRLCARLRRTYGIEPVLLTPAARHGLRIGYRRPRELGSDRLAAALGARALWPGRNVIVVDCGTATTVTALTAGGVLAGGAILPGFGLWAEMLAARTAQLPAVAGAAPRRALGRGTRAGIAAGLHHGHAGAIRELVGRIGREAFGRKRRVVVGTGGNATRFSRENLFAQVVPDLILLGLSAFAHA